MASFVMTIRGDQLGTFTGMSGNGNGADRVVTLSGVQPYGTANEIYSIHIDQAASDATQFANGQWISIRDSQGNLVMGQTIVQPDNEQGLGAGDEHLIISSANFLIDLQGVTSGIMAYGATSEPASVGVGDNDGQLDFADTRATFPCFGLGTAIATPTGNRPAEDLAVGDWVSPVEGPPQRLIWVGRRTLHLRGRTDPRRPIRIGQGRLGAGLPTKDLLVSPQHRFLMPTGQTDPPDLLIAAKGLTHLPGIRPALGKSTVTVISLMTQRHAILSANGAPAESFFPGVYMLGLLPPFQRLQILAACPALRDDPATGYGPAARPPMPLAMARARATLWRYARSSLGEDITT